VSCFPRLVGAGVDAVGRRDRIAMYSGRSRSHHIHECCQRVGEFLVGHKTRAGDATMVEVQFVAGLGRQGRYILPEARYHVQSWRLSRHDGSFVCIRSLGVVLA
jgi:hypothetical protein